jgi:hypothetical protein
VAFGFCAVGDAALAEQQLPFVLLPPDDVRQDDEMRGQRHLHGRHLVGSDRCVASGNFEESKTDRGVDAPADGEVLPRKPNLQGFYAAALPWLSLSVIPFLPREVPSTGVDTVVAGGTINRSEKGVLCPSNRRRAW